MKCVYDKIGIAYHTHVTTINKEGGEDCLNLDLLD